MENSFSIYSGFYRKEADKEKYSNLDSDSFFEIWYGNTRKYYSEPIYIVGCDVPILDNKLNIFSLSEYPNLGHVGDYLNGNKTGRYCGWTAGVLIGLLHAYCNNKDFVYKEQDCLAFGSYVEQMRSEIGDNGIIFGKNRIMGVAQALFYVKRDFIPQIISYLSIQDDKDVLPEYKFGNIKEKAIFSFGYDRDRPINVNDAVFYLQQITELDLEQIKHLL